jgi:hypothetical protein
VRQWNSKQVWSKALSDIEEAFSLDNLKRAWRWTLSNPLPEYKNYFRDVYAAFALASDANLCLLKENLDRGIYKPTHACKAYPVKPSGLLRTYTLLSVEDQIVYQALINVIAEKTSQTNWQRPQQYIFGNQYAGKKSQFFYRKWTNEYRKYSQAIRQSQEDGFRWVYSFDLTAFFDSISHEVLRNLLKSLRHTDQFIELLLRCLKEWTAILPSIYHGHGIPQGPQPSGILAEVVMGKIDREMGTPQSVKYFRYIDDIWLMSKDERALREMAVRLDISSKSFGLFPQASKIALEEVDDPTRMLKSISNHPDRPLGGIIESSPNEIEKELIKLSRNYEIDPGDESRFKFLLGRTKPSSRVAQRLIRILENKPHLYGPISRYLAKYPRIPKSVAHAVLGAVKIHSNYSAIASALLESSIGRVDGEVESQFAQEAQRFYREASKRNGSRVDELRASSWRWRVKVGDVSFDEWEKVLRQQQSEAWWFRKQILSMVPHDILGEPSSTKLLSIAMTDPSADVSLIASDILTEKGYTLAETSSDLNLYASCTLSLFGLVPRAPKIPCGIHTALHRMLRQKLPDFEWMDVFGSDYSVAEQKAVRMGAAAEEDATKWVNLLDTFHDLLLKAIFSHDDTIGNYSRIGSILQQRSRFARKYPSLYRAMNNIHKKRGQSELSHPFEKQTGKPTAPIKFRYISTQRGSLFAGYSELIESW